MPERRTAPKRKAGVAPENRRANSPSESRARHQKPPTIQQAPFEGRTVRRVPQTKVHRRSVEAGSDTDTRAVTLPGGREILLTRRTMVLGAAGLGALALAGGGAAWAANQSDDDDALRTLTVPQDAVSVITDFDKLENPESALALAATAQLPYGSLIWASDDALAACLLPTQTAKPLAQVGILNLESGECTTVLEHATGEENGFEIYDVRANSHGIIWVEANIMDGLWRVMAATLEGTTLGDPVQLDEDDENWEMPTLAVAEGFGFWQRLPRLDGNARVEDSLLKRAAFGSTEASVVYASQGRMACAPASCGDGIVFTPRARTGGTYYQLTRLDATSGNPTEVCVLPSSMRPAECSWGATGFSFVFDGIYNYGDGIANMGTYLPLEKPNTGTGDLMESTQSDGSSEEETRADAFVPVAQTAPDTEAYSDVPWFSAPTGTLSAPCWCGSWLMLRGLKSILAVDIANRCYTELPMEEGSGDYNDFLASTHRGTRAVTYCNIDYTPIGGEQQKYCFVRIWQPAASSDE